MVALAADVPNDFVLAEATVTVNVIPDVAPIEIYSTNPSYRLEFPSPTTESGRKITVMGVYANGDEGYLGHTGMGTTYLSHDTNVVSVDSVGLMTTVGPGRTFISIQNSGLRKFIEITVPDSAYPYLPTIEHTSNVVFGASGFRRGPATGFFNQQMLITNVSSMPLAAPLDLVLIGLPSDVVAEKETGVTESIAPAGSPFFGVSLDTNTPGLLPGESVSITLSFSNPSGSPITYTPKLFSADDM
jgi:hypothetical protein